MIFGCKANFIFNVNSVFLLILFFHPGLVDHVLEQPAGQLGRVWEHGGGGLHFLIGQP